MRKVISLIIIFLLTSCKDSSQEYSGYIDTDLIYLSSDFPGRLDHLLVKRGDSVQKDQLLFKLEKTSDHYGVEISQFNHKNLIAQRQVILDQLHYNEINYHRTLRIRKQDAASQNDLDLAREQLDVLKNQLAGLDVQIKSSKIDIANKNWQILRKENRASEPGIIFDTYMTQDEYVQAGQPILSLITQKTIKVIFFAPEKALSTIQLNQTVKLSDDNHPKLATGHISYIAQVAQYTPPIIYSREEREKLVFRIEARIANPNLKQIHLGQPVTIELIP